MVELIDLPASRSEPILGHSEALAPIDEIDRKINSFTRQLKSIQVPQIHRPSDEELKNAAAEDVKERPRGSARKQ